MRQRHVVAHRKVRRNRHEAEQPVLQPLLLVGRRRSRQRLQPLVDLQRVAVDRDRVLSPLSQQFGQLDRYPRLTNPGGAEDRQDPQRRCVRGRAETPLSVCEVADSISTGTNCPGPASPSKLTALPCRVRPRSLVSSVRLVPSTNTSSVRPTKRWARSAARRCTTSTSRSIRSTLTGWGS